MIERVAAAVRLAAQVAILPRFGRLQAGDVEEKSPGEAVTIADRETERMLSAALLDIAPGSIVVGQEAVAADPALLAGLSSELAWLVDPLDGTANFIEGTPHFSVMVALLRHGEAVAAWMLSPAANVMHIAERGSGAWTDGRRVSCPVPPGSVADLEGAVLTRFLPARLREGVQARAGAFREILPGMHCAGEEYPAMVRGRQNFALFWRNRLYRFVEDAACRVFPQIGRPQWQFRWAGKVALTSDHMPRLHELAPGLRACLGYNGRGVAMATALGQALGDWAAGGNAEAVPLPPTPLRPLPFHALRRPVLEIVSAYLRLRDRMSWRGRTGAGGQGTGG